MGDEVEDDEAVDVKEADEAADGETTVDGAGDSRRLWSSLPRSCSCCLLACSGSDGSIARRQREEGKESSPHDGMETRDSNEKRAALSVHGDAVLDLSQ